MDRHCTHLCANPPFGAFMKGLCTEWPPEPDLYCSHGIPWYRSKTAAHYCPRSPEAEHTARGNDCQWRRSCCWREWDGQRHGEQSTAMKADCSKLNQENIHKPRGSDEKVLSNWASTITFFWDNQGQACSEIETKFQINKFFKITISFVPDIFPMASPVITVLLVFLPTHPGFFANLIEFINHKKSH